MINAIGIAGPIGHGKSLVVGLLQSLLQERGTPSLIVPFAEEVKRIAHECFGWDFRKDARGRRLLQILGTDAGRRYNPDIWVNVWLRKAKASTVLVIADDVRFENEADAIRKLGGAILHIHRPGGPPRVADHETEAGLRIIDEADICLSLPEGTLAVSAMLRAEVVPALLA